MPFFSLVHSLHASIGLGVIKTHAARMNCGLLSVGNVVGVPHREKCESKKSVITGVVTEPTEVTSGHFEWRS